MYGPKKLKKSLAMGRVTGRLWVTRHDEDGACAALGIAAWLLLTDETASSSTTSGTRR